MLRHLRNHGRTALRTARASSLKVNKARAVIMRMPVMATTSRHMASISSIIGASFPTMKPDAASMQVGLRFSSAAAAGDIVEVAAQGFPESVSEGSLTDLTKEVGDFCELDEVICQIETDKTAIDVRSPVSGKLVEILAEEDDTVEAGQALFRIEASDDVPPPAAPAEQPEEAAPAAETSAKAEEAVSPTPAAPAAAKAAPAASSAAAPPSPSGAGSSASGGDGPSRSEYRKKMSRMRLTIARRLKDAQNTAAMLTTFNEVDMTAAMEMRKAYKDDFEKAHGARLGFMSIFSKACAEALMEIPAVNARIDGETNQIVYHEYADISVAVASPRGLVVPVMRNVESMSFLDIERTIADFGMRAKNDAITMEDMAGGTFSISNGGVFGSMMGTPILNPPQAAILGMHSIKQRPMVVDGEIKARPVMYLALTYDHRLIDGREAVTFLCSIRDKVEDPRRLLLNL